MNESHLSVIIDLSPSQWHLSSLPLNLFISQLLTFLNAYIALKHENTLAVFAALPGKRYPQSFSLRSLCVHLSSVMLYASSDPQNQSQPIDSNVYQPFKLLDSTVVSRISHELDHLSQEDSEGSHDLYSIISACSSMHSPLRARRCLDKSLVLCGSSIIFFIYIVPFLTLHSDINRISIGSSTTLNHVVDPRILILSVSPDLSTSYIPIMNSIFSAQKLVRLLMTPRSHVR